MTAIIILRGKEIYVSCSCTAFECTSFGLSEPLPIPHDQQRLTFFQKCNRRLARRGRIFESWCALKPGNSMPTAVPTSGSQKNSSPRFSEVAGSGCAKSLERMNSNCAGDQRATADREASGNTYPKLGEINSPFQRIRLQVPMFVKCCVDSSQILADFIFPQIRQDLVSKFYRCSFIFSSKQRENMMRPFTTTPEMKAKILEEIRTNSIFKKPMKWGSHEKLSRNKAIQKRDTPSTAISMQIEALKREYAQGIRKKLYDTLAKAMVLVLALRVDQAETKAFFERLGKKPPASAKAESKITQQLLAYVTNVKCKLASKYARAVDYLVDYQGIHPEDLAAELVKRGGIEAVANEASAIDPRRVPASKGAVSASSQKKQEQVRMKQLQHDTDGDWGASEAGPTTMTLELSVKLLADILSAQNEQEVVLNCTRFGRGSETGAAFSVKSVRLL